jgi:HD superfamily phosphodiesterase
LAGVHRGDVARRGRATWSHTLGVVNRTGTLRSVLAAEEFEALVDTAYLHDIGYALVPLWSSSGVEFHAVDDDELLDGWDEDVGCNVIVEVVRQERRSVAKIDGRR